MRSARLLLTALAAAAVTEAAYVVRDGKFSVVSSSDTTSSSLECAHSFQIPSALT